MVISFASSLDAKPIVDTCRAKIAIGEGETPGLDLKKIKRGGWHVPVDERAQRR
jgi:hypothetical protein